MKTEELLKQVEDEILSSYESMYRLAYSYAQNQEDAMDIVQESVYKAIKNANHVKQAQYIKTWLCRIVMNTAMDFLRKDMREVSTDVLYEDSTEDTYHDFDTLDALKILDERERAVIVLRFFEDQPIREVAQTLQLNVNTVKTILYRSLKKLRVSLEEKEVLYEG